MLIVIEASNEHNKFSIQEKNILLFRDMKAGNIFSFTCRQGLGTATCFYTKKKKKSIVCKHFHLNNFCIKLWIFV
jgi:hypothetical protein